jgi:hypothetical protein
LNFLTFEKKNASDSEINFDESIKENRENIQCGDDQTTEKELSRPSLADSSNSEANASVEEPNLKDDIQSDNP